MSDLPFVTSNAYIQLRRAEEAIDAMAAEEAAEALEECPTTLDYPCCWCPHLAQCRTEAEIPF